ncbi:MAG: electron transfer flavoprotein-ubiquinone oxidoreductase [Desulfohalobiaceae bacterium]|nr:electron transfer flavoprotein-ubiquinone oxidoreductase [Desulfohalobiaceae bacterium]
MKTASIQREQMEVDVLFVGAGPASLAGAIRLMQIASDRGMDLEVAVIEKGTEVGAHAVSGAVLKPEPLFELLPDALEQGCPIESRVRGDGLYWLTKKRAYRLPLVPRHLKNQGRVIISLSRLTRWLGERAEALGVNIFPGFAGTEVLFGQDGRTVVGVRTDDKGLDRERTPRANFEPGIDLKAGVTVLGEGARGSLCEQVCSRLGLKGDSGPEQFEVGIKEVIQLQEADRLGQLPANALHFMGHPLGGREPGGGFIYEMDQSRLALGFLLGLGYREAGLDVYDRFLQFKSHPFIHSLIKGGKVLEQGARTVNTGGLYTMPALTADGLILIGNTAGFHNTPALKGVHLCMQSGMLAAETIAEALASSDCSQSSLQSFEEKVGSGGIQAEMLEGRNCQQALNRKGLAGFVHLGAQYLSKGRGIIDPLPGIPDHLSLKPDPGYAFGSESSRPLEDEPELFPDQLTGVYLSRTGHREDQPCHLEIHDPEICRSTCLDRFGCPCTRFCPGGVYELDRAAESGPVIRINFANCLHCKTCEIKDPFANITWHCPEGGDGPKYKIV